MFWPFKKKSQMKHPRPLGRHVLVKPDIAGNEKYAEREGVVVALACRVQGVNVGDRVLYWAGGDKAAANDKLGEYHLVLPDALHAVLPPKDVT